MSSQPSDPAHTDSAVTDPAGDTLLAQLDLSTVRVYERDQHPVSRRDISPQALKILYTLGEAGYQAFLVGGGVRDLLLGSAPKDFDIATDATPEEVRRLFRNSRIIGRRFKIVHIQFGREIFEVTTFRAHHDAAQAFGDDADSRDFRHLDSAHSATGMILRDNVYGDINDDAARRDFTVNALYYTVEGFRVLDFCGGMDDLQQRRIRVIGDPGTRYKEDPVRMLRAVRFAAKLGFSIEPASAEPIESLAPLLASVSPARLFDEALKLLSAGFGAQTLPLLQQYRVGRFLIPDTLDAVRDPDSYAAKFVQLALCNTDHRIREDKSVTPAFLFAALLWPVLLGRLRRSSSGGSPTLQDLLDASDRVIADQLRHTAVPRRFTSVVREIWELQTRFQHRTRRGVETLLQHPRFRAGYDFLLLREAAGEPIQELCHWWTEVQSSQPEAQQKLLQELAPSGRRRRPRRRRRPAQGSA